MPRSYGNASDVVQTFTQNDIYMHNKTQSLGEKSSKFNFEHLDHFFTSKKQSKFFALPKHAKKLDFPWHTFFLPKFNLSATALPKWFWFRSNIDSKTYLHAQQGSKSQRKNQQIQFWTFDHFFTSKNKLIFFALPKHAKKLDFRWHAFFFPKFNLSATALPIWLWFRSNIDSKTYLHAQQDSKSWRKIQQIQFSTSSSFSPPKTN